jgi:hypothetical protein
MEGAQLASQEAAPALANVPLEFWEALCRVARPPASKLPEALTRSTSFSLVQDPVCHDSDGKDP